MRLLLTNVFAFASFVAFSQSTQSNGVVVHEASGVEVKMEPTTIITPVVRTINDWTLPECIDALNFLELKKAEVGPDEQVTYQVQQQLINDRIRVLKSEEK